MFKKLVFMLLIIAMVPGALLAQDIIVQAVTGKVTREKSPGVWVDIKVGDKLLLSTKIHTSLNSHLTIKVGERVVVIKPMTKQVISMLIGDSSVKPITGVQASKDSNINASSTQTSTNIPTASTRAVDASPDVQWDE